MTEFSFLGELSLKKGKNESRQHGEAMSYLTEKVWKPLHQKTTKG